MHCTTTNWILDYLYSNRECMVVRVQQAHHIKSSHFHGLGTC